MRSFVQKLSVVLSVFIVGMASALAQGGSSTLSGRVTDAGSLNVADAKVQAVNAGTNVAYPTTTNVDGRFTLPSLPPGTYKILVDKTGFKSIIRPDVELHVADNVELGFNLQVGQVDESVTVTGGAPLVNTTTSALGGLINDHGVANLPLNGRNYINLTLMQPGVTAASNVNSTGSFSGTWFSSNGAPIRSNNFMIDGAIMQDLNNGSTADFAGRTLGLDGIQEYRLLTNSYSAEYGIVMGSQTIIVSKAGTNQFHGSAFEYARNSVMDAANFFDKPVQANNFARLPAFQRNNFGGSFGGPIRKDKTFFFATYEGVKESLGITNTNNVPAAGCHGAAGAVITSTACPQLAAGTSVTIAAVAAPLLALYPVPNLPNNQATVPYSQPDSDQFGQMRVDQVFSTKDTLFGRYTINDDDIVVGLPFPEYFLNPKRTRHQYATLSENHIFSAALLNVFGFSFSRTATTRTSPDTLTGPDYSLVAGQSFGQLSIGGLTTFAPSAPAPNVQTQNILTLNDDLIYTPGKHSLKFGTLINRYRQYGLNSTGAQGTLAFGNLAGFLKGTPTSYSAITAGSTLDRTYQFYTTGFYVQDDWRALSRLTLNLGLRYEPAPNYYHEVHGLSASLINIRTATQVTVGPLFSRNPTLLSISPRLGLAWDVFGNGKTSIRGGAALLYDVANMGNFIMGINGAEPPFSSKSTNSTPSTTVPVTLPLTFTASEVGKSIDVVDYNLKQSRLYTENLTVEQQFPHEMVVAVAYAGSRGIHLQGNGEGNPAIPTVQLDGSLFWSATAPRQNTNFSTVQYLTSDKDSTFNALEVTLTKRATRGLQFQSSYTWAKLLDNAEGGNGDCESSAGIPSNPYDSRFDRGLACFAVQQSWVTNFVYTFPTAKFKQGMLSALANGWGFSGISTLHSGLPFNPWETVERARTGVFGGTANPPVDRPSFNAAFTGPIVTRNPQQYFNPAAFMLQPAGTLGNVPRDTFLGPGFANFDFSVKKDTGLPKLGDTVRLELRAELFNVLNHPNFNEPTGAVFAGTTTDTTESPLSTAGVITSTISSSRQLQLSARIIF